LIATTWNNAIIERLETGEKVHAVDQGPKINVEEISIPFGAKSVVAMTNICSFATNIRRKVSRINLKVSRL
tara:strand:- start:176 stop:388 length:213 start_codon:yes stop_codon:yes gene_type:complete